MTTEDFLDSIYLIPAFLELMDDFSDHQIEARRILEKHGITDEQIKELTGIVHLIRYHHHTVRSDFHANYSLLRLGLKEYFKLYLSDVFKKLNMVDMKVTALDYGCGDGQIARQFLKDNPRSGVMLVDREDNNSEGKMVHVVDFEKNPDWYLKWENVFDYVILSEVLHCKRLYWQQYLIQSSMIMLKKHGSIIIMENDDVCMEYRIGKIKRDAYNAVNIEELAKHNKLEITNHVKIKNHHTYVCTKV